MGSLGKVEQMCDNLCADQEAQVYRTVRIFSYSISYFCEKILHTLVPKTLRMQPLSRDVSIPVMPLSGVRACLSVTVSARRNAARPASRGCATSSARNLTVCHIARHSITGSDTRRSTTSACCSVARSTLIYLLVWTNLSPMAHPAIARQSIIRSSIDAKQFVLREFVGWVSLC